MSHPSTRGPRNQKAAITLLHKKKKALEKASIEEA
jgi:hypothetical protein